MGIKWPNDLVAAPGGLSALDDRKLAGILAESVVAAGEVAAVVVGIGINVNWPDPLPDDLMPIAVSLDQLAGRAIDRTELVVAVVRSFEAQLGLLDRPGGAAALRDAVSARSATIGRHVRVQRPADDLQGVAIGLTSGGQLLVRTGTVVHEVGAGDVVHLRPSTPV